MFLAAVAGLIVGACVVALLWMFVVGIFTALPRDGEER